MINWKKKVEENIEEIERAVKKVYTATCGGEDNSWVGDVLDCWWLNYPYVLSAYLWYDNSITWDMHGGNFASRKGIALEIYSAQYHPRKKLEDYSFDEEMEWTHRYLGHLDDLYLKLQAENKTDKDYSETIAQFWKLFKNTNCFLYNYCDHESELRLYDNYKLGFSLIRELLFCNDEVPEEKIEQVLYWLNGWNVFLETKSRLQLKKGCTYIDLMPLVGAKLTENEFRENTAHCLQNARHYVI